MTVWELAVKNSLILLYLEHHWPVVTITIFKENLLDENSSNDTINSKRITQH